MFKVLILTRKDGQAVMSVLGLFCFVGKLCMLKPKWFFFPLFGVLPTQALVFSQQYLRNTSILSSSYHIIQILFFELAGSHHLSLTTGSILLNLASGRSFKP